MDGLGKWVLPLAIVLIPVLLAISLHEAAHGYVARLCGDPTASDQGRVTLNPLKHIDPVGTLLLPVLAFFLIGVPFGYAKPVPIDLDRLRRPRLHAAYVAFAGPAANLLMGLGWTVLGLVLQASGHYGWTARQMVSSGVLVNAAMFVFNMLPIPPLDGGEIVLRVLPRRLAAAIDRLRSPPLEARRLIRALRAWVPRPLAGWMAAIRPFELCVFLLFVVLLKYRVLDGFLIKAVKTVSALFAAIVSPLALPLFKLLS